MTLPATPLSRWLYRPQPLAKVAVLRTIVGLYLPLDLYIRTSLVLAHSYGSSQLYDPVDVLAYLHQPAPVPWFTQSLRVVIIVLGVLTAFGIGPRVLGWLLAFAYTDWTCLAMSYGKVDHDHLAIIVAAFVIPTVSGASWRSTESSESAGWALRCVEVAVIATYFLAAVTKVRLAGWHWASGAIFTWAIVRRGTWFSNPLLHHPHVLLVSQWALFVFELATPVFLVARQRWRTVGFVMFIGFHTITQLALGINFAPLIACLFVLLPLERAAAQWRVWLTGSSHWMSSVDLASTYDARSAGLSGRAKR